MTANTTALTTTGRRQLRCTLRRALLGLILACGVAVSAATGAQAAVPGDPGIPVPTTPVSSLRFTPPGFTTDGAQALNAAESDPTMRALHAREHPLSYFLAVWRLNKLYWDIQFTYHGKYVAEVDVSPQGRVINVWAGPLAIASYARGNYEPLFDTPWVAVPFALMFLVLFLDPRRLLSWRLLDGLGMLSFLVSYSLFDHAHLEPAVWLAYPPQLYLLGRMLWLGLRGGTRFTLPHWLSVRVLAGGLVALVVARVTLSLVSRGVLDVGYASVIGAFRAAHGEALYYATSGHGDTYGPIAYLAYLPFELLFPWHGNWDYLPSAHAAAIFFDLVTIAGLVKLGRMLRSGRDGLRLGLALGWGWAACPFTLLCLLAHSNDGLIAMLSVLALLAFNSAPARGALLGLAAAAKFSPAGILPLLASGRDRSLASAVRCSVAFTAVVVLSIGLYLPPGGLSEFWARTLHFQLTRSDVFSPWALHAGLDPLKTVLEAFAVLLAVGLAFGRRQRTLVQVSALAGAVTIAIQLPAIHWFYYYIVWFMPFVLVAVLGAEGPTAEPSQPSNIVVHSPADSPSEPIAQAISAASR